MHYIIIKYNMEKMGGKDTSEGDRVLCCLILSTVATEKP